MGNVTDIKVPSFEGIDAVLIDLDNTLFDSSLTKRLNIKSSVEELGATWTPELHSKFSTLEAVAIRNFYGGKIDSVQYGLDRGQALIDAFGLSITPAEGSQILLDSIKNGFILLPRAKEAIEKLYGLMVPLCIASNGIYVNQKTRLDKLDLTKYFTHIFVSDKVGSTKPLAAFYEHALKTVGTTPERTMMIGDEVTSDIVGAKAAGLKTCFIMRRPGKEIPPEADYYIVGIEDIL